MVGFILFLPGAHPHNMLDVVHSEMNSYQSYKFAVFKAEEMPNKGAGSKIIPLTEKQPSYTVIQPELSYLVLKDEQVALGELYVIHCSLQIQQGQLMI